MAAPAVSEEVLWRPHPGPQTRFLQSTAFEVLYGGAAGGGKSQALVYGALRQIHVPKYHGIILRRTFPELSELIELSLESFGHVSNGLGFGRYNEQKKRWRWPGGAVIEFGYCETYRDVLQYQGDQFQYVGWDELGQIPEERTWTYLLGRVRKTHPSQQLRMRASANPGGAGHFWLKARFIERCPPDGRTVQCENNTRAFFPAFLKDNPTLMQSDPGYAERLKNLPELEYKWLAEGDWSAGGGLAFPELARKQAYLVAPFDIPAHWFVWAGFDWGYNHPWRMGLYAQDEDGVVYGVDTTGGRHQQPPAIADRFWTMVDRAKIPRDRVRRIVAGHDVWADVKARSENIPTLADQFRKLDTPLVQANISRIAGVQNLRRYFAGDPPRFRLFDTPGNRRKLDVLASRIADPDEIEDVRKVDADEHGEGGDDDYDECLVGWTSVQTDDGWQSLASMVGTVGKCLTPIGWRRYDSVRMTRRSAPTIRVRDEHGRTINATPNHPILTIRGWVELGRLHVGDEWVVITEAVCHQRDGAGVSGSNVLAHEGRILSAPDAMAFAGSVGGELRADSASSSCSPQRREPGEQPARELRSQIAEGAHPASLDPRETAQSRSAHGEDSPADEGMAPLARGARLALGERQTQSGKAQADSEAMRAVWQRVYGSAAVRALLPPELQDASADAPTCRSARVVEIAEGPTEAVYNLEVADVHCFAVGGVVVHNCRYSLAARPLKTTAAPVKQAKSAFDPDVLQREADKFRRAEPQSRDTIRRGVIF